MDKTRPQNSIITDLETILHTKFVRMFIIYSHTKLYTSCYNMPLIIAVQTKNYLYLRLAACCTISAQKYFNNFRIPIIIYYLCVTSRRLFSFFTLLTVGWLVGRSIGRWIGGSVGRSVGWLVSLTSSPCICSLIHSLLVMA